MRCRDELVEMMLRRIRRTQAAAKEQLAALHDQHRDIEETLIGIFGQVLETAQTHDTDAAFGSRVRKLLSEQGGVDGPGGAMRERVRLAQGQRSAAALAHPCATSPAVVPACRSADIRSATQDCSLLDAWAVVSTHRHARRADMPEQRRSRLRRRSDGTISSSDGDPDIAIDRRALEVCVFIHLADALQTGDSTSSAPRTMPTIARSFCPGRSARAGSRLLRCLGIPARGEEFAAMLKAELTTAAAEVDAGLPDNTELSIDDDGTPHLKRLPTTAQPDRTDGIRAGDPRTHAGAPPPRHSQAC